MSSRLQHHGRIPPSAAPPIIPSPSSAYSSYLLQSPSQELPSPTQRGDQQPATYSLPYYDTSAPRISLDAPSRPHSRATSAYQPETATIAFPEPQLIFRSTSQRSALHPPPNHRHADNEDRLSPALSTLSLGESRPPSIISADSSPDLSPRVLSEELSNQTLCSAEGLRRFQAGELPEKDEEWYRLVPDAAREVLERTEVLRQSNIFEIIKSERDYVRDLELVKEVFVEPLYSTYPVTKSRVRGFIGDVFSNLDEILVHHRRMLDSLFVRQQEQHPLVQSVADIILDASLLFCGEYESYIKHYPIAAARHRKELQRNANYQSFIQQCSQDPQVRKRDLVTFLSRPVTRLPRLKLQLETLSKHTAADHPDMETIPIMLGVLSDFLKSTQPGIAAAEAKVKFWTLCENLAYQKGEMIDLDLYDDSRTLLFSGPLARRYKNEMSSYVWADLHVALLDNYLLLLQPKTPENGRSTRHVVVSRPIPLDYLRLAAFDAPPESRKEKQEDGGLLNRHRHRDMFPFTIYHASAKSNRRYTLWTTKDEERAQWHNALQEALTVWRVRQEGNKWFVPEVKNETFFKYTPSSEVFTGKILSAALIRNGGKQYLAVGCASGVYFAQQGTADFRKVLTTPNTVVMVALSSHNKFIVHCANGLLSFALDLLVRVASGVASPDSLNASSERISPKDATVLFFRTGHIEHSRAGQPEPRTLVLYASKGYLQPSLNVVEVVRSPEDGLGPHRPSNAGASPNSSFRPFGASVSIQRDAHNIVALNRKVGICTEKNIVLVDPTNLSVSSTAATTIPRFAGAEASEPLAKLKERCYRSKALGLVRCGDEILVVYDELGCYVDRLGVPSHNSGYVRWETKATSYAHRGKHLILFSADFIEIRTVDKGKLVQVIEAQDVRLVYPGLLPEDDTTLVAMRGADHRGVITEKLVSLVETTALNSPREDSVWDAFSFDEQSSVEP